MRHTGSCRPAISSPARLSETRRPWLPPRSCRAAPTPPWPRRNCRPTRWPGGFFHAPQVSRFDDRLLAGPEMPEAVIVIATHLEFVFVLDLLVELVADPAVEHGVGGGIILHQIGHEQRAHLRKNGRGSARRASHRDAA